MLSGKQQQIALFGGGPYRWTLVSGPVGSGKTHAALIGWLLWMGKHGGHDFGVLIKGKPQLASVLKGGIEALLHEELRIDSEGCIDMPGANGMGNRLWCFVAQDRRAEPRLRSYNLRGILIDEATTLPDGILQAANGRLRVGEDARGIMLTNPDGPRHPVKRRWFDRAGELNAQAIQTKLADNPALPASYVDSIKSAYAGHMLRRMVYGEWAAASGLVFPHCLDVGEDAPDCEFVAYDVVIDVGESSVTHALLSGRTADGMTWIIDEWRWDHVAQGVRSARDIVSMIRQAFAHVAVHSWIVDPAALRFRQELLAQLGANARVGKAENDWAEGVEEVNHWMGLGALRIWGDRVPELMDELGALTWDEDAKEAGKDVPVATPDHGADAMRYLVFTRAVHESGGRRAWEENRKRRLEIAR